MGKSYPSAFWGLLWYEVMMWGLSCLGHYWGEGLGRDKERISAPKWFRKLFGDFRREGTLEIRGVIVQGACYITTFIGLVVTLGFGLSKEMGICLAFGHLFLSFLGVVIVLHIAPHLFQNYTFAVFELMRFATKRLLWENIANLSTEADDGNAHPRGLVLLPIALQAAL